MQESATAATPARRRARSTCRRLAFWSRPRAARQRLGDRTLRHFGPPGRSIATIAAARRCVNIAGEHRPSGRRASERGEARAPVLPDRAQWGSRDVAHDAVSGAAAGRSPCTQRSSEICHSLLTHRWRAAPQGATSRNFRLRTSDAKRCLPADRGTGVHGPRRGVVRRRSSGSARRGARGGPLLQHSAATRDGGVGAEAHAELVAPAIEHNAPNPRSPPSARVTRCQWRRGPTRKWKPIVELPLDGLVVESGEDRVKRVVEAVHAARAMSSAARAARRGRRTSLRVL